MTSTIEKNHLYESNGIIHLCEGSDVQRGIKIVWTKCQIDVPADRSFMSTELPTCKTCMEAQ